MSNPTLSVAIEGFLLTKAVLGRSENTINDYRNTLSRFCKWIGDQEITQVDAKTIEGYFLWLQQEYKYSRPNSKKEKQLQPKSVVNIHTTLAHFWAWVSKEFDIEDPFKVDRINYQKKPIVPMTEEEIDRLLGACDNSVVTIGGKKPYRMKRPTRLRDKAIIMCLYDTGLRVSALCNIRFDDMDLSNNRIRVLGKGKKERYVYIGKLCAQYLWKYQTSRFPDRKPDKDDYVFVNQDNMRPMNRNSVREMLGRIGEKAGVKDCYPHRFRHSFACAWLRNGGDPYTLQDLLGHTSMEMTKRY